MSNEEIQKQINKVQLIEDMSILGTIMKEEILREKKSNPENFYSNEEIIDFFKKALPNYDPDRVRQSDMRKVLSWYNILAEAGINKFVEEESEKENA